MRAPAIEWSSMPALGDVVQEQRDIEQRRDARGWILLHQIVGEREFVVAAALDLGQHADAAQQVLVHRVVVVHVELHHRDDAAELADEAAEHAGLVHAPQHDLGVVREVRISRNSRLASSSSRSLASISLQRAGGRAHGVGVERQIVLLREAEHADQVDRIALEHVVVGDVDAVVVDDEIVGLGSGAAPARAAAARSCG